MKRNTLILLAALLIGLIAAFVLYERFGDRPAWTGTGIDPTRIGELKLYAEGDSVVFTRKGSYWVGDNGTCDFLVSQQGIGDILSALGTVVCSLGIDPSKNGDEYGLNPPQRELWCIGGSPTPVRLELGRRSTFGWGNYFRIHGQKTVWVLQEVYSQPLFPTTREMADLHFLPVPTESLTAVTLHHEGRIFRLEQRASAWYLDGAALGDSIWPDEFLQRLALYEARDILLYPSEDRVYGLDAPDVSVELTLPGREWTLEVGPVVVQDRFLRLKPFRGVWKVESRSVKTLFDLLERCQIASSPSAKL